MKLAIGNALGPAIADIGDMLAPAIEAISRFAEANPNLTRTLVAATAALLAFKVAATGLSFLGLTGKAGALSMLAGSVRLLGAAAAASGVNTFFQTLADGLVLAGKTIMRSLGPLRLLKGALMFTGVGAVITMIVGAGTLIYNNWEKLGAFMQGFGEGFRAALAPIQPILDPIVTAATGLWNAFNNLLGPVQPGALLWAASSAGPSRALSAGSRGSSGRWAR
jgi:phage-related tail protein